jgi:hypothetical protein
MDYHGVMTHGTDQRDEATEANLKLLGRNKHNSHPAADLDDTPFVSLDTPFFHIDLIAVVRAAGFAVVYVVERNC